MQRVRKSANITSMTGRMPSSASPMQAPVMPASLMGVEMTRSGKVLDSPWVTLKAPP
jgi:hypothetical protein